MMKKRYQHCYTYWLYAILWFSLSAFQLYTNLTRKLGNNSLLRYIFCVCWFCFGIIEIYYFYKDRKNIS